MNLYKKIACLLGVVSLVLGGCRDKKDADTGPAIFTALDSKRTGLDFVNKLTYSQDFNLFKYIYFYNGSGVGAGDFNNDGLVDLFFGSNQGDNKLFLNKGGLKFSDVSDAAGIPKDGGWSTGISVVDINNDGLLDIYVCRVGQYETLKGKNLFLINQGVGKDGTPTFKDMAADYGLDFSGFSTQSAFFDYDGDGDLDMFLMNHSVHQNGTFKPRKDFANTYHAISGDRLYRNDGEKFTDVTKECGINSSAIGYGLGITIADINMDGWPDIYIGNDFHENDYMYMNNGDGTFTDQAEVKMMHTSQFSMGVDVADINNDALPEIISMDMLPEDPYILKRSLGEDAYDIFQYKIKVGYSYQFTRNNLQFNRGNGLFSEIGLYSDIAATDWSWAPLWMDFDNDGWKDLFVSNGIPKRMNDIDYINFLSNAEVQQRISSKSVESKDLALINKFPEIKLPNKFFRNTGDLRFEDASRRVEGNAPSFSNGAIYADLDNDGDLDVVVNNIDDPVFLYENKTNVSRSSVQLKLKGTEKNIHALGARVILYTPTGTRTYEKNPARGFLSSMEIPLHIGMKDTKIDSAFVIWPDRTMASLKIDTSKSVMEVAWQAGLPVFDFSRFVPMNTDFGVPASDITMSTGIDFIHQENHFIEFDREALIPHMVSSEGPALAVGDVNKDGLDDLFIGGARNQPSAMYLQRANGRFSRVAVPELAADSSKEDVDAVFADMNRDGFMDLLVASGGNEYTGKDIHNQPRLYLGDGRGGFEKKADAFDSLFVTASCIVPMDVNGDGAMDVFIGARAVPWEYGEIPVSYLMINDGSGKFVNSNSLAPGLDKAGMITGAVWTDIDGDGDQDLVLAMEWGAITAFVNNKGSFTKRELTDEHGWWNFITPVDIDGDGDMDLIAGNLGLNSRLRASAEHPVKLYHNDFDGNGKREQVLTYFLNGKEIPFANKAELEKQMPVMKKNFLYAEDFAKASLDELFGKEALKKSPVLSADYFSNALLVNDGAGKFSVQALPATAQFTPYRDAVVIGKNAAGLPSVLLSGNYYDSNIEMGRYDADYGTVLRTLNGSLVATPMKGVSVRGQVRKLRNIVINGKPAVVAARNNEGVVVLQF